jgi:hypothetical protein
MHRDADARRRRVQYLEEVIMGGLRLLFTFLYACCVFAVGCGQASAQEQAVLERDAALLTEPRNGAPVVAQLKQGASGEVIARKGAWVNLKTASGAGWLFSFNVRFQAAGSAPAASGGARPATAAGTQPRRVTATIGIRGLDAEDLKAARYDEAQMRLLDGYAASKGDAQNAARASGLMPAWVEYLK